MKKLIKKILKEDIKDDFEWIKEIPSYELGDFLSDAEVCDNSNNNCEVNINDGEIVFVLDYEDWKNHVGLVEDMVIEQLFRGYSGYYNNLREIDSDEINYLYYFLTNEQKHRFNKILETTTNGLIKVSDLENDNFSDIRQHLIHPNLKRMWDSFVWDYISPLESALETNTWNSLTDYYKELLAVNGIEIDLYNSGSYYSGRETIEITVPIKFLTQKGMFNLSDVIEEVSEPFVQDWLEIAYQEYDTSGAEDEVSEVINNFLDDVEEFLEEEGEDIKPYQKFFKILENFGFKDFVEFWVEDVGRMGFYTKNMGENLNIGVAPRIDDGGENVYLVKQKKPFSKYGSNNPFYKSIVPLQKLPQYLYQYNLNLESTK